MDVLAVLSVELDQLIVKFSEVLHSDAVDDSGDLFGIGMELFLSGSVSFVLSGAFVGSVPGSVKSRIILILIRSVLIRSIQIRLVRDVLFMICLILTGPVLISLFVIRLFVSRLSIL